MMRLFNRKSPVTARYMKRMLFLSIGYVASVGAISFVIPDQADFGPLAVILAMVPGLFALGWIWAMGSYLAQLEDEYIRMLEIRKFLVATGFIMGLASIWGLIELFTDAPRIPVFFIFPIWCLGLAVGQIINKLTMGDGGNCA